MPMIDLSELGMDLESAEITEGPVLLPSGWYTLEVAEEPELRDAKNPGKDGTIGQYVNWHFQVTDDPEHGGQSIYHSTSLKKNVITRRAGLLDTLRALGIPYTSSGFNTADAVGRRCYAEVGTEFVRERREDGSVVVTSRQRNVLLSLKKIDIPYA